MHALRSGRAPLPLLAGFAVFVAAIAMLVAAPLVRRDPPTFRPTPATRERPGNWQSVGDTLTIDATDDVVWARASLSRGRVLAAFDSSGWEIAAQRHRLTVAGSLADLGVVPFETASVPASAAFVASRSGAQANEAIDHWYRYSFVTHLLSTNAHVYAFRARDGQLWKLQVVGYYCPGVIAGCMTLRYAPLSGG